MSALFETKLLTIDDTALGTRLIVHHLPAAERLRGLVVHVHPFAEEMNKARRMTALQSRALAAAGFAVLRIDLLGCGDSAGDFGDATWVRWVTDVVLAVRWLRAQYAAPADERQAPLWLWGLRAGSLLAAEAGARLAADGLRCDFLFWQPAPQGKLLLLQFLRLKAASELLAGQAKAAMDQLRAEIAAGRRVVVSGYTLAPSLCQGLDQATLRPPDGMRAGRVVWLEVSAIEQPTLAPASAATMDNWRNAGWTVQAQAVRGPAFWQTTEIEDAPALIEATDAALGAAAASAAAEAAIA